MKLAIASDLHLEFDKNLIKLNILDQPHADILILAGDIIVGKYLLDDEESLYFQFFRSVCNKYQQVLYILGNHEFYHGNIESTPFRIKNILKSFDNLHILDNDGIIVDDTLFLGSTLWTDGYSQISHLPFVVKNINKGMNDFRFIAKGESVLSFKDTLSLHHEAMEFIGSSYEQREGMNVVVITHHSPSFLSCHPRFFNNHINYCYCSELGNFITNREDISLWIHGHTHDPFDYNIGKTRVICNPRGYTGYDLKANDYKFKIVTL